MTQPILVARIADLHIKRPGELAYREATPTTTWNLSRGLANHAYSRWMSNCFTSWPYLS